MFSEITAYVLLSPTIFSAERTITSTERSALMVQVVVDPVEAAPSGILQGLLRHHSLATYKHEDVGGTNPGGHTWEPQGKAGSLKAGEKRERR